MGGFLRHVVPDAVEGAVLVGTGVEPAIGGAVLGRTVEVAADGDGRNGDGRLGGEALFVGVVTGFAGGEAQPPPVVVDDDVGVVGVVERRRGQVVGGVVEVPQRGGVASR